MLAGAGRRVPLSSFDKDIYRIQRTSGPRALGTERHDGREIRPT